MEKIIKSVQITADIGDGKTVVIDESAVYRAIRSLHQLQSHASMLHVSINYQHGEKKKANFDAKIKAISWLNLHDTEE